MDHKHFIMPPPFHYIVKSKLIRNIQHNKSKLLVFEDEFIDPDPIIAREKAFNHYQNYVDVLLQSKGKTYVSDAEARRHLNSFINVDHGTNFFLDDQVINFHDSYENGLGIYLKVNLPIPNTFLQDKSGDEFIIHGIENFCEQDFFVLMDNLFHEYWYYEHYSCDMKDYKEIIHYNSGNSNIQAILKTPFDWKSFDRPLSDFI